MDACLLYSYLSQFQQVQCSKKATNWPLGTSLFKYAYFLPIMLCSSAQIFELFYAQYYAHVLHLAMHFSRSVYKSACSSDLHIMHTLEISNSIT